MNNNLSLLNDAINVMTVLNLQNSLLGFDYGRAEGYSLRKCEQYVSGYS
jgi:hypothetical protein